MFSIWTSEKVAWMGDSSCGNSRESHIWSPANSNLGSSSSDISGTEEWIDSLESIFRVKSATGRPAPSLNLPPRPAKHFTDLIIRSLNNYDHIALFHQLKDLCTTDAMFVRHTYSLNPASDPSSSLLTIPFPSLQGFCDFFRAWTLFIPDGVFQASHPRVIVDVPPSFVFISCLSYRGLSLSKHIDFLNSSFEDYPFTYHEQVALWEFSHNKSFALQQIEMTGSLVLHVNSEGLISRLELYLTQQ